MSGPEQRTYRVGEFAKLAGVTARALHHYDRLGLLSPHRSPAGYRIYTDADLERLAQVVALKFIGISLDQIRRLTAASSGLAEALQTQRLALEEKKRMLDLAIDAVREAERVLRRDGQAEPAVYRRIVEVIEMQSNNDWNSQYQQLVEAKAAKLKALGAEELNAVRRDWTMLLEDARAALGTDPAGPHAQALGDRWLTLLGRVMGQPVDPSMVAKGATQSSGQWGPSEADRPVWDFMKRVLAHRS